jgi:uncharacterized protein YdaU (DUF1376 family)
MQGCAVLGQRTARVMPEKRNPQPPAVRLFLWAHLGDALNYYEHHLGDYLRDTAHLSMVEDGAYRRLIDLYYTREESLPANLDAVCRLVRARTEDERAAVIIILDEFFDRSDDGYRHKRCDEELARAAEKRRKAQESANARWGHSERNANALPPQSEGNALQSPVTSNQSPEKNRSLGAARPRGARRCPVDWSPRSEDVDKIALECPDIDHALELAKLRDY